MASIKHKRGSCGKNSLGVLLGGRPCPSLIDLQDRVVSSYGSQYRIKVML